MSIEPSVVELNRVFQGAVGCINYFDAGLRAVYEAGVAAERERCARIAIDMATESHWNTGPSNAAHLIAAAIRADDAGREETR